MSVKLRSRKASKGRIRYYLDIVIDANNRSQETLFYVNPGDDKKQKKELAEEIKRQRELEVISKGTQFVPKHKNKIKAYDFLDDYYNSYTKKDIKTMNAVILKFKEFTNNDKLLLKDITEDSLKSFIEFLIHNSNLKGETPKSYYRRFKKILNLANDKGLINNSVIRNLKFKNTLNDEVNLKKEILTEDEIKILFDTELPTKKWTNFLSPYAAILNLLIIN